jgi:hypothetical protein
MNINPRENLKFIHLSRYCEKLPQAVENQRMRVFHVLVENEVHGDPQGRGERISRARKFTTHGSKFSLSSGERAGVRGNETQSVMKT